MVLVACVAASAFTRGTATGGIDGSLFRESVSGRFAMVAGQLKLAIPAEIVSHRCQPCGSLKFWPVSLPLYKIMEQLSRKEGNFLILVDKFHPVLEKYQSPAKK